MSNEIQKLEVQGMTLESVIADVEAIEAKWATIPDASEKKGYELCRAGATEAQKKRTALAAKRDELKKLAKAWSKEVDEKIIPIEERFKAKEDLLRAEYRRIDDEKKRAKEEKERIERERVAALKERVLEIGSFGNVPYGESIKGIEDRINTLGKMQIEKEEFAEFYSEAIGTRDATLDRLCAMMSAEQQRIENERLAAEERARIEEQQRIENERLKKEREVFEAAQREHAEKMRIENERIAKERAEREAEDEKRRAEDQARIDAENARIAEERANIEAEKAEQRRIAAEEERKRFEEEQRIIDEEFKAHNREEIVHAFLDLVVAEETRDLALFSDLAGAVADAIIAGKIPHVAYVG